MRDMSISRRRFVFTSLATPIALGMTGGVAGGLASQIAAGAAPAVLRRGLGQNEKLRVLKVGVGGMGGADLGELSSHKMVEIVGLCDVSQVQLDGWIKDSKNDKGETVKARFPDVPTFKDWREAYTKLDKNFDAVSCSTADHMHAPISMAAMNLGKHVYCQKPLAQGAWENRRLAEVAASKPGIVTQMGTQRIATKWRQYGGELIRNGTIGPIKEVYAWTDRPAGWWPQGNPRPEGADPVPAELSWDLFLGVSSDRPYKNVYTPFKWRGTIDWGTGAFGDMGCHMLDVPFYELGLGAPISAYCTPVKASTDQFPESESVVMKYAPNKMTSKDGLTLKWFDGGQFPDFKAIGLPDGWEGGKQGEDVVKGDGGVILVGEKGIMWFPIEHAWARIFVDGKAVEMKPGEFKQTNHWHNWVDACVAGKKDACVSRFEKGGKMCESLSIGAMSSLDPGKVLEYDAEKCVFKNSPAANAALRRTYRKGWEVENLSRV
ncbi:MAG: 1,5-anhydro-D-fructose reductase [Planctomycetota bacterium]